MKSKILGLVIAGTAGCILALPAFASPMDHGVNHGQYSYAGYSTPDTRHFGTSDFQRVDDHIWGSRPPMPSPAAAPEFSQATAATALTLLMGGLAFLRARRRRA